jgi:hypothetical protein
MTPTIARSLPPIEPPARAPRTPCARAHDQARAPVFERRLRQACYCPAVADPRRPAEFVTLTHCDQLIAAQLLCGRLDAEGIECFIPDEHMANQTWHLNRAIGGIRVQVRQTDLDRAKQILAEPAVEPPAEPRRRPNGVHDDDDETIGPGDRAAYRAMRVALVSLWLMGLIHPYSLFLAVRALGRQDVTAWGKRRALIALAVSVAGCAWMTILVLKVVTVR